MTWQHIENNLVINGVLAGFANNSFIEIWEAPYTDSENLYDLQNRLSKTHWVTRNKASIQAIPYKKDCYQNSIENFSKTEISIDQSIKLKKLILKQWIFNALDSTDSCKISKHGITYIISTR